MKRRQTLSSCWPQKATDRVEGSKNRYMAEMYIARRGRASTSRLSDALRRFAT